MGWKILMGFLCVVGYVTAALALARRRYAIEDAREDASEEFRGSFGGDQGASDGE